MGPPDCIESQLFSRTLVRKSAATSLGLVISVLGFGDFNDWGYYVLLLEVLLHLLRNLVEGLLNPFSSLGTHLHEKYRAVLSGKFLS